MDELNVNNATHFLKCRHVIGHGITSYRMRCHVLKVMADGRVKGRVYGERYWKNTGDTVKVRYVLASRVIPIEVK